LNYKVWGEPATKDFYFYPDGFGSRTVTLQTEPKAQYEIEELLILTPPAGYPLRVLPQNLIDVRQEYQTPSGRPVMIVRSGEAIRDLV
jgi:hypothetical protein